LATFFTAIDKPKKKTRRLQPLQFERITHRDEESKFTRKGVGKKATSRADYVLTPYYGEKGRRRDRAKQTNKFNKWRPEGKVFRRREGLLRGREYSFEHPLERHETPWLHLIMIDLGRKKRGEKRLFFSLKVAPW